MQSRSLIEKYLQQILGLVTDSLDYINHNMFTDTYVNFL